MLLTIVLVVFALHVVAWLALPGGRPARVGGAAVRLYRHVAITTPVGDTAEG